MKYNAENMSRFLGEYADQNDVNLFVRYLTRNGWELHLRADGMFHASKNGIEMTEAQWADAITDCFRR